MHCRQLVPDHATEKQRDRAADSGASGGMAVLLVAANIGDVRLIDNLRV